MINSKTPYQIFSLAILILFLSSFKCIAQVERELLPIYIEKMVEVNNTYYHASVVDRYIEVDSKMTIQDKIRNLCNVLSKDYFNGAKMELLEIKTVEGLKVMKINLAEAKDLENDSEFNINRVWYHYFQGTTLGGNTTTLLTETLLQRHYKGEWINAVFFYWNHVPFPFEYGHVKLNGIITCYPIKIDRQRLEKMF